MIERMHADIRADVQSHAADTPAAQQRELDPWRQQFNHVRPHQALGGKVPADVYKPANKRKPTPLRYRYAPTLAVARVFKNGHFRYAGEAHFLSTSLAGMFIGLEPTDAFHLRIWLHDVDLGVIEALPNISSSVYHLPLNRRATAA